MPSTTDFNNWLSKYSADLNGHNTLSALYGTISTLNLHKVFSIKTLNGKDNQWLVTRGNLDLVLVFLSEDVGRAFLSILNSNTLNKIGV